MTVRTLGVALLTVLVATSCVSGSASPTGSAVTQSIPPTGSVASPSPGAPTSSARAYRTTAFKAPFSIDLGTRWQLWEDDERGVTFGLGPLGLVPNVQLLYIDNVAAKACDSDVTAGVFPTVPWTGSAADLIQWMRDEFPASIAVGTSKALRLGGASGVQADLSFSTVEPCRIVHVTMWQPDNSMNLHNANEPFRIAGLDVHGATVLICYFGEITAAEPAEDQFVESLAFESL